MQRSTLITRKAPLAGAMGLLVWAVACGGTDNPETAARWESGSVGPLAAEIPAGEFRNRRERLLAALPDGITLLHARPAPKTETEWGFVQDPSFYYFTGIGDLTGAVVALDGPASQVVLFLPPAPESFGFPVPGLVPPANDDTARELGMDAVHPWDHLAVWVDDRLAAGVAAIYVDEARRPEPPGVPSSFSATSGALSLWASALEERFPSATFRSAKEAIHDLRWRKSPAEAAILRANAANTAVALAEVARAVQPGMRQRQAEAVVVASCIEGGGEGPSFWPWVMSGPNAQLDGLVQAFFRYSQLDRVMREGEVIRVDIGCAGQGYGADVGRTLP
ncbi:MAG: aminopeptidase P N-terminal domain-containing protein, partial [Gemmatimonadota bacterium]|nr:aminopeptidase P N-terminal domain-containing protein [Gemmatimonadota bacterium]